MSVSPRAPRVLVVSKFAPGGLGLDEPYWAGEWRDGFELSVALTRLGARVEMACPAVLPRHREAVLPRLEALARTQGVRLWFGRRVFNNHAPWLSTFAHSAHWLRRYLRLRPDLVIFTQARNEPGLWFPGVAARSLVTCCEPERFVPGGRTLPKVAGSAQAMSPPPGFWARAAERPAAWLGHALLRTLLSGDRFRRYGHIGLLVPPDDTCAALLDNPRFVCMTKGVLADLPRHIPPAPEPLDFLFCGTISPAKGLFTLLEAFGGLPPEATLGVMGTGPAEHVARLRALAAGRPGLKVLGTQGYLDKYAWFRAARVFVLPSLRDYYPSVILEALACGLPVITSQHIPSPVRHEHNGLLVPAEDAAALAQAMGRLRDDPELHARLAANARASADALGWESAARAVLDTLGPREVAANA